MTNWASRKYRLACKLAILFTILLVVPNVVSLVLQLYGFSVVFALLDGGIYLALMSLLFSGYFASNVMTHYAHRDTQQEYNDPSDNLPEELQ